MQYLAAHYWQSAGGGKSSMLLQQVYHKRKKMPVVLACVCTNKELVTELSEWFYETALPICSKKGERGMRIMSIRLKHILEKKEKIMGARMAGVLCLGESVCFFQRGEMKIRLLNMKFQRAHSFCLQPDTEPGEKIVFREATIQPNVGILLATEEFWAHIPQEMAEECLDISQIRNQGILKKHLCELGDRGAEKGGTDMGAVLLLSR